MLKLKHPPLIGLYIRDMPLPIFSLMDNLLPIDGKPVFPLTMPFSLLFPPMITLAPSEMPPMMHPNISTPWNHRTTAELADARKTPLSILTLSINERIFHIPTPNKIFKEIKLQMSENNNRGIQTFNCH
jgi:hypothetical protein